MTVCDSPFQWDLERSAVRSREIDLCRGAAEAGEVLQTHSGDPERTFCSVIRNMTN